jgi:hypothetical protein
MASIFALLSVLNILLQAYSLLEANEVVKPKNSSFVVLSRSSSFYRKAMAKTCSIHVVLLQHVVRVRDELTVTAPVVLYLRSRPCLFVIVSF